jgi:hypothetical protein
MDRRFLQFITVAICLLPLQARAGYTISILSETYHVSGSANETSGQPSDQAYNTVTSASPAYGSITEPFDASGFNDAGAYTLHAWSSATGGQVGNSMIFNALARGYDPYEASAPESVYAETNASLAVDFMLSGSGNDLSLVIDGYSGRGMASAILWDLTAGTSGALLWAPEDSLVSDTMTIGVDTTHIYRLELLAASSCCCGTAGTVQFLNTVTAPTPGALLLTGLGTSFVTWLRRQRSMPWF